MQSVSVVVVSYYTGPILFHSVASLLASRFIKQLIVVDNGNPAEDVDKLRNISIDDPRLVLLTGHGNLGFAKGCNLGVSHASGEMLLLLNPDCIVPNNGIKSLLQIACEKRGDWLLSPKLVNPDRTEQQGARREILTPWIAFVEGFGLYKIAPNHPYFKRFGHHHQSCPDDITEIPVTSGACMLMPLQTYRKVGGMDEHFFFHVEDVEFCLRFRKAGGKIFYCPHVSFVHALGSSEVSRTYVEWHKSIGFKRYFRLHFSGVYPPGFVSFVNFCITLRFFLIAIKELVLSPSSWLRRRRAVRGSDQKEVAAGPVSFTPPEGTAERHEGNSRDRSAPQNNHMPSSGSSV